MRKPKHNRMKNIKGILFIALISSFGMIMSCGEGDGVILFTLEDDKQLGAQVAAEIASDTSFNILSETEYPQQYAYLQSMTDAILNSGQVTHKDDFVWKIHIIHDDVLNAFATPGGYIYVYTGLIKYLDKADDLAGVMGHELAHADQRHSVKAMQRQYGIQLLLSIALGNDPSQLTQIAAQIAGTGTILAFGRDAESEADDYSVQYLSSTGYACNGAYSFFQKLIEADATGNTPTFLSTHPDPKDRVEDINTKAKEIGCDTTPISETGFTYQDFQNSLPE